MNTTISIPLDEVTLIEEGLKTQVCKPIIPQPIIKQHGDEFSVNGGSYRYEDCRWSEGQAISTEIECPYGKYNNVLLLKSPLNGHAFDWVKGCEIIVAYTYAQRLWVIDEATAQKDEGIQTSFLDMTYRDGFRIKWDESHADKGFAWKNNPWVWVIEFRLLQK